MTQQAISITYAGKPCILADRQQYPQAAGKANSFYCPVGPEPGRGYVLMLYADVAGINMNQPHPLVFVAGSKTLTLPVIFADRASNVSGGRVGRPERVYLVELTDIRAILKMMRVASSVTPAYNCVFPPGYYRSEVASKYIPGTLNNGAEWTWQQMLNDLWSRLSPAAANLAGPPPALPFTPRGVPLNYNFDDDTTPWDAINIVLANFQWAVNYDPVQHKFSYVQLGSNQPGLQAALNAYPDYIDDADVLESNATRIPQRVHVHSKIQYPYNAEHLWDQPAYGEFVRSTTGPQINTNVPGVQNGSVVDVYENQLQNFENYYPPTNATDLTTADGEITIRVTLDMTTPSGRIIIQGIAPEFRPGSIIKGVLWRNYDRSGNDGGFVTEAIKGPGIPCMKQCGCEVNLMDELTMRGRYNRFSPQVYPPQDVIVTTGDGDYVAPVTGTYVFPAWISYYVTDDDDPGHIGVYDPLNDQFIEGYKECWLLHVNSTATIGGGGSNRTIMPLPMLDAKQPFRGFAAGMASYEGEVRPLVLFDADLAFEAVLQEPLDLDGGNAAAKFLDRFGSQRGNDVTIYSLPGVGGYSAELASGSHVYVRWIRDAWRVIEIPYDGVYADLGAALQAVFDGRYVLQ